MQVEKWIYSFCTIQVLRTRGAATHKHRGRDSSRDHVAETTTAAYDRLSAALIIDQPPESVDRTTYVVGSDARAPTPEPAREFRRSDEPAREGRPAQCAAFKRIGLGGTRLSHNP